MGYTSLPAALVLGLCLFSASCAARGPAATNPNADLEDVRKVELQLRDALSTSKADVLEHYLADDYVHTNFRGVVRTKREILDDLEDRTVTREYLELDDIHIQVIGDVAILTARTSTRRTVRGTQTTGDYRQMRIFKREQGIWRAIVMQTTLVAP